MYFSSYATSNEVFVFHLRTVASCTSAPPFLVGRSKPTPCSFTSYVEDRILACASSCCRFSGKPAYGNIRIFSLYVVKNTLTTICLSCLLSDCPLLRLEHQPFHRKTHWNSILREHKQTQAQAAGKLLHCTVLASYTTCQHGTGCYFKRTQPPQSKSKYMLLLRNIKTFCPC
jgi:hypothetical protein